MDYLLTMGNRDVGKVQVISEGLYVRIVCHAELYGSVMYRLVAVCDGRRESIGILAPQNGGYGLDRKIPAKRMKTENLEFILIPSHERADGRFIPLHPEEPFEYLDRLKDAYMERQKDQVGVVIPN